MSIFAKGLFPNTCTNHSYQHRFLQYVWHCCGNLIKMVQTAANSAVICTQSLVDITCISVFMSEKDHVAEKLN